MSGFHQLDVTKNLGRVEYQARIVTFAKLRHTIAKTGLVFHGKGWEEAAAEISQNPIVERVTVTWVTETSVGVWRNGVRSGSKPEVAARRPGD